MSERPTPETDGLVPQFLNGGEVPDVFAHCRKLERERDEANYFLKELAEADGQLKVRINELCEVLQKSEQERDEARDDAAYWKSEYEIVVARLCGVKHKRDNGIIFEHEIIPKLERERDEAREDARLLAYRLTELELQTTEELARLEQELNKLKEQ